MLKKMAAISPTADARVRIAPSVAAAGPEPTRAGGAYVTAGAARRARA